MMPTGSDPLESSDCFCPARTVSELPLSVRMRAAIEMLPFTHPKLAVTAMVSEQDFATVLDRRLKRIEEMKAKVIEAKPPQLEAKSNPMPSIADKRYRRM